MKKLKDTFDITTHKYLCRTGFLKNDVINEDELCTPAGSTSLGVMIRSGYTPPTVVIRSGAKMTRGLCHLASSTHPGG